jgi:glycogen operon protein
VNDARRRVRRAMLATVLLAQGTPMLCAGDEFGNSQAGNNNAYCQDNATGWLDWQRAGHEDDTAFVARLVALRRTDPLLRHARWFALAPTAGEPAIHWCTPAGNAMTVDDWHAPDAHAFACALADDADAPPRWLLAFNPSAHDLPFTLPPGPWHVAIDSSATLPDDAAPPADGVLVIPARALCLLRRGAPLVQETAR